MESGILKKLFQVEYLKTTNNKSFRVIISMHFLLFIILVLIGSRVNFSFPGFTFKKLYRFPHVWEYFTWLASWLNLLLVILVIIITGNEYNFKTFKQHIINGFNRKHLLTGKLISIFFISVYALILVLISVLISGIFSTKDISFTLIFQNFTIIFSYFIQTIAYMCMGLLFVILLRNTALSIVLFIMYRILIEPIIRVFFDKDIRVFFPSKIISNLTPFPRAVSLNYKSANIDILALDNMDSLAINSWVNLFFVLVYIGLFILVGKLILKNQNF